MHFYIQRDYFIVVEAATPRDIAILVEEVDGHQRNPEGNHKRPDQACEPTGLRESNPADAVMWMDYFKVAIQSHNCHECNTASATDSQHEEVDAAPDLSKHPVVPSEFVVDAEGYADEEQEVS